jgi:hypothetical protein
MGICPLHPNLTIVRRDVRDIFPFNFLTQHLILKDLFAYLEEHNFIIET